MPCRSYKHAAPLALREAVQCHGLCADRRIIRNQKLLGGVGNTATTLLYHLAIYGKPEPVEHITPRKRGGQTIESILALACQGCNEHKHAKVKARDPLTGKQVSLFHPRRQPWADHFVWSADVLEIIGLMPTWRATVSALQLNRAEVVSLRRILFAVGEHPPPLSE